MTAYLQIIKDTKISLGVPLHASNPSYSGGTGRMPGSIYGWPLRPVALGPYTDGHSGPRSNLDANPSQNQRQREPTTEAVCSAPELPAAASEQPFGQISLEYVILVQNWGEGCS